MWQCRRMTRNQVLLLFRPELGRVASKDGMSAFRDRTSENEETLRLFVICEGDW
jgi:hypothetical protein